MRCTEDCVWDNSMTTRSCPKTPGQPLVPADRWGGCQEQLAPAARWGRHWHLSSSKRASEETQSRERGGEASTIDLAGRRKVTGSVASPRQSGITLVLGNGHCQIQQRISTATGLQVVTYPDFSRGEALPQHFLDHKHSKIFLSLFSHL